MVMTPEPLLLAGSWQQRDRTEDIRAPYDQRVLGSVSLASRADVDAAVAAALEALRGEEFALWRRVAVLEEVSRGLAGDAEGFARCIANEAGKPLAQARAEVVRATETFAVAAAAARSARGEVFPAGLAATNGAQLSYVLRVPIGVVAAITPFNFPLNLVAHKIAPALAAGTPVVLKPAPATPLTALRLARLLVEAGVPRGWLSVLPGTVEEVAQPLILHPDIAAVTFTGSAAVGWGIRAQAPRKKVLLELGSTAPLVVDETANWEVAAAKTAQHGFSYAGQSCISVQRVIVHEAIASSFVAALRARVRELVVGDPLDDKTQVGPLITASSRERVLAWIGEAERGGAQVLEGGTVNPDGTLSPTLLAHVPRTAKLWCEEVFGPVVVIEHAESFAHALALANDSGFGLQAGLFTRDLDRALRAAAKLEFGGVVINEAPTQRLDAQPYGGTKDSGNTREGPAYLLRELTVQRFVSVYSAES